MSIGGFNPPAWERREGATHALEFCLSSIAGRECVATALRICSFSGLRTSLLRPVRDVGAGMDL